MLFDRSANQLLTIAIEHGIIDISRIQDTVDNMRKDTYLKKHNAESKIWEGKDGRWYTRVRNRDDTRRLISRSTKADLEQAIISHYEDLETQYETFIDVYSEWRKFHDQMIGDNSISKYDNDMKRFFVNRPLCCSMRITDIKEDDVSVFIRNIIEELRLCKTTTKRMMGYMQNTFLFAMRHNIITSNPMQFLLPKEFYRYCYESERSKKPQVFRNDEISLLNEEFKHCREEGSNYIPFYAVEMAFLTGMRVGELSALTWDSVSDTEIIIDKSEKTNRKTKERYIDKTKNGKVRTFPVTEDIKQLLIDVRNVENRNGWVCEWVFADASGRVSSSRISSCIKNRCKTLHIDQKGIHSFRKTLNSHVKSDGVSTSVAASLFGHSEEVNNEYYTFDVTDVETKKRIVEKVNSEMRKL